MQHYRLKHEIITVCKIDYRISSLLDAQQFDEDDHEARELGITSATWSLFGVVWPASHILAATVSTANLAGKRVLEVGCGIGLTSIVLHKMDVDITASDYHPRAREFLNRNVLDNGLSPIKYQSVDFEQKNSLLGKFDLIIASDVLYQPHQAEYLARLISNHSSDDVEVIIVDPARENRAKFTHNMIALGYCHRFTNFNEQLTANFRCKGRILYYNRRHDPVRSEINSFKTQIQQQKHPDQE